MSAVHTQQQCRRCILNNSVGSAIFASLEALVLLSIVLPLSYVLIHERMIKWTWVPVALFPISIPMMGVYELLGIAKYGSVVSNHMPIMFIPHIVTIMEFGAFCRFAV